MDAFQIEKRLSEIEFAVSELRNLFLPKESLVFPVSRQWMLEKRICLECEKEIGENEKVVRGNHATCYQRINRAIKDGEISEGEALAAGLLAPKEQTGPKPGSRIEKDSRLAEVLANKKQAKPKTEFTEEQREAFRAVGRRAAEEANKLAAEESKKKQKVTKKR